MLQTHNETETNKNRAWDAAVPNETEKRRMLAELVVHGDFYAAAARLTNDVSACNELVGYTYHCYSHAAAKGDPNGRTAMDKFDDFVKEIREGPLKEHWATARSSASFSPGLHLFFSYLGECVLLKPAVAVSQLTKLLSGYSATYRPTAHRLALRIAFASSGDIEAVKQTHQQWLRLFDNGQEDAKLGSKEHAEAVLHTLYPQPDEATSEAIKAQVKLEAFSFLRSEASETSFSSTDSLRLAVGRAFWTVFTESGRGDKQAAEIIADMATLRKQLRSGKEADRVKRYATGAWNAPGTNDETLSAFSSLLLFGPASTAAAMDKYSWEGTYDARLHTLHLEALWRLEPIDGDVMTTAANNRWRVLAEKDLKTAEAEAVAAAHSKPDAVTAQRYLKENVDEALFQLDYALTDDEDFRLLERVAQAYWQLRTAVKHGGDKTLLTKTLPEKLASIAAKGSMSSWLLENFDKKYEPHGKNLIGAFKLVGAALLLDEDESLSALAADAAHTGSVYQPILQWAHLDVAAWKVTGAEESEIPSAMSLWRDAAERVSDAMGAYAEKQTHLFPLLA